MEPLFVFDSKEIEHKSPFGAVPCGTEITLTVKSSRIDIKSVTVVLRNEDVDKARRITMEWSGICGDYDTRVCTLSADDTPCILWYHFEISDFSGGTKYFGKGNADIADSVAGDFQITVYNADFATPDWFSQGVTYQVFVDRFNRAKESEPISDDDNYFVHKDASDCPHYLPDENGVIQNRDIYGGNLAGVIEKLPYLSSLGVTTVYLNPIFEAWSNHKYNTADYKKIDPHFGTEDDLKTLCAEAASYGIHVILDGVFSHTGSDSLYFNKNGRYPTVGAYQSYDSPYREWYQFDASGKYSSWWGIETLPQVDELNTSYRDYIIGAPDSVIAHWMSVGISGWRLDVADELPDAFIAQLKERVRHERNDAIVIGEVWEDASTKEAYGVRRKYFTDGILDGVMNYPVKNAILGFLTGKLSGKEMCDVFLDILENYPEPAQKCLMNIIGTHDTIRAVNALSVGALEGTKRSFRASRTLSSEELETAKCRLRQAAVLQYVFPGSPCIYYGDEIGMQGFEDPFNRRFYEWNREEDGLRSFYRSLGILKKNEPSLHNGAFRVLRSEDDSVVVSRGESLVAAANRSGAPFVAELFMNGNYSLRVGIGSLENGQITLPPNSACIFVKEQERIK